LHNAVGAGLTSSIFTLDVREAERFVSNRFRLLAFANVNIGPSSAEIGGAFGSEKETGGGREATPENVFLSISDLPNFVQASAQSMPAP
jgi:aldehyde dehydrogenase (NAD+)